MLQDQELFLSNPAAPRGAGKRLGVPLAGRLRLSAADTA
jgi:hypothetical protein